MGRARIVSGGPDGRYTIEIDLGEAQRAQLVALYDAAILKLQNERIPAAEVKKQEAQDYYDDEATPNYETAEQNYILAANAGAAPATLATLNRALQQARIASVSAYQTILRKDQQVKQLEAQKKELQRKRTELDSLILTEQREAWCLNLTEDGEVDAEVATVEIPGESDLILIDQGCRAWTSSDGLLASRYLMRPEQAFWNVAVLPGWQKFLPTFRWGTLSDVDYDNNTATVTLAAATSSGQFLNVNQDEELTAVPFYYPPCDANAFQDDDEAVIYFAGQDWSNPYIVGFVDNPKGCNFSCMGEGPGTGINGGLAFRSDDSALHDQLYTDTLNVQARVNGGAWFTLEDNGKHAILTDRYTYAAIFDNGFGFQTEPNITLQVMRYATGEQRDRIICTVSPPGFPITGPIPTTRNIAEYAVYIGASIVLNLAMTDRGWYGTVNYGTGSVKCPGGIRLVAGSDGTVTRLEGYTLVTQE